MTLQTRWTLRVFVLAVLVIAPRFMDNYQVGLLGEVLVFGLAAASVDLLVGFGGMPTLGHAAFFGLGAYAAGLMGVHQGGNVLLSLVLAIGVAVLFAVPTGYLAVRTHGIYFLMLTLAFAELLHSLAITWNSLTGGSNGLSGIPRPVLLPGGGLELSTVTARYYYVLAVFALCYWLLRRLVDSPFGHSLVGIASNAERSEAIGYDVNRRKLIAYTIAGTFGAIAGALHANLTRIVAPGSVGFEISAFLLVMVLLGGVRRLYGALIGAAIVVFGRQELTARYGSWEIGLGIILLVVVYLLPRGIGGIASDIGRRFGDRHTAAEGAA